MPGIIHHKLLDAIQSGNKAAVSNMLVNGIPKKKFGFINDGFASVGILGEEGGHNVIYILSQEMPTLIIALFRHIDRIAKRENVSQDGIVKLLCALDNGKWVDRNLSSLVRELVEQNARSGLIKVAKEFWIPILEQQLAEKPEEFHTIIKYVTHQIHAETTNNCISKFDEVKESVIAKLVVERILLDGQINALINEAAEYFKTKEKSTELQQLQQENVVDNASESTSEVAGTQPTTKEASTNPSSQPLGDLPTNQAVCIQSTTKATTITEYTDKMLEIVKGQGWEKVNKSIMETYGPEYKAFHLFCALYGQSNFTALSQATAQKLLGSSKKAWEADKIVSKYLDTLKLGTPCIAGNTSKLYTPYEFALRKGVDDLAMKIAEKGGSSDIAVLLNKAIEYHRDKVVDHLMKYLPNDEIGWNSVLRTAIKYADLHTAQEYIKLAQANQAPVVSITTDHKHNPDAAVKKYNLLNYTLLNLKQLYDNDNKTDKQISESHQKAQTVWKIFDYINNAGLIELSKDEVVVGKTIKLLKSTWKRASEDYTQKLDLLRSALQKHYAGTDAEMLLEKSAIFIETDRQSSIGTRHSNLTAMSDLGRYEGGSVVSLAGDHSDSDVESDVE